jgi:predicted phage baseplate assembly protein
VLFDTLHADASATNHQACRITVVHPVTRSDYLTTGRVSQLRLDRDIRPNIFALRTTVVLVQSELLRLANTRPLPEPVGGATLILGGQYPTLTIGQAIVVSGRRYDTASGRAGAETLAQDAVIDDLRTDTPTPAMALTVISLRQPLAATYARSATTVSANVAPASHGETVRDEVLGSGDGSAFQGFMLRKSPLSYVQAPSAESGVASTLQVTVNGVRWTERSDLTEAGPQERVFSASQDEANKTTVMFGDGVNGARPPTGRDSVHARYRFGIGAAGDVAAGAITKLVDSLPGLQAVVNPEPTSGGADPESNESVRSNAPASLRTFGRAVSIEDYAALALAYPGVRLARAAWVRKDDTGKALAHPAIYVTVATANGMPLAQQADYAAKLRRFLDSHRDPNVPMRIVDAGRVYIDIAAIVDVDDAYGRHATLRAAQAALYPGTNPDGTTGFFGRLNFGEAVHLSSVYAALQMVPGVRAANITTLRLAASDAPGTVRDHILVAPSAIAFIANDPSDLSNQYGKVSVDLGVGGFAD